MTEDERQLVEVEQSMRLISDIADLIAAKMKNLPQAEADALLDQELVRLAISTRHLQGASEVPGVPSDLGFNIRALVQARVAGLLGHQLRN